MPSVSHCYHKVPIDDRHHDFEVEENQPTAPYQRLWLRSYVKYLTFHCILIFLYTLTTYVIVSHFSRTCEGGEEYQTTLTYSPAHESIKNVKYVFNAAPNLTSPYVGDSRPSLDKAWHDLLQNTNMRISKEDLQAINRTSIPLGHGGGYYGEMAVFHELHCLKFIRQAFHMEYYSNQFGQREKETMGEHTEHCIEILRQSVMCRADTTLITFRWGHTVKLPQPDFTLEHTCADWNALMDWAAQHSINVFEEGMLVHPTLGPAYPGGYRDDRPHPVHEPSR